MKLFAFVRRARRTSSAAMTPEPVPVAPENAAAPTSAAEKRRRRPSTGSASWKPTLVAISEDAALAAAKAEAKGKPAAAKAKARPAPRASRTDYDDFRLEEEGQIGLNQVVGSSAAWRFGGPTVLPAFAPTAFLF